MVMRSKPSQRPRFSKMTIDFLGRRYGRLFPMSQTKEGVILHVGDELRSRADPAITRRVVCFFHTDHDEVAFGFTPPEQYDPIAPMWQQEAVLRKYEKA